MSPRRGRWLRLPSWYGGATEDEGRNGLYRCARRRRLLGVKALPRRWCYAATRVLPAASAVIADLHRLPQTSTEKAAARSVPDRPAGQRRIEHRRRRQPEGRRDAGLRRFRMSPLTLDGRPADAAGHGSIRRRVMSLDYPRPGVMPGYSPLVAPEAAVARYSSSWCGSAPSDACRLAPKHLRRSTSASVPLTGDCRANNGRNDLFYTRASCVPGDPDNFT